MKILKKPLFWVGIVLLIGACVLPFVSMSMHKGNSLVKNIEAFYNSPSEKTLKKCVPADEVDEIADEGFIDKVSDDMKKMAAKIYAGEKVTDENGDTYINAIVEVRKKSSGKLEKMYSKKFYVENVSGKECWIVER